MENERLSIAHNLSVIRKRIHSAEQKFNRAIDSVTLVAVSKYKPVEDILSAIRAGQLHFGESYTQEAVEKIEHLHAHNLTWHFIGPIQKNKTRLIARHFDWVHSIDREIIATRLNDQRELPQPPLNTCIQVNIDQESTKSGIHPSELLPLAKHIASCPNLRLRGIMAVPAPSFTFELQQKAFYKMRDLFIELQNTGYPVDTLSIGMSDDLEAAVSAGATLVRIGSAIFGARE